MFSVMYDRPLAELAVKARAPPSDAPMHTSIALCSDSTGTIYPFVKLNARRYSMISDWGVIGYAPAAQPRASRFASPASARACPAT